jgi:KUP system potassium uptake protein
MGKTNTGHISRLTLTGLIITLGIVYGDIGTSPLYVMRAIVSGAKIISPEFILGGISCIIWTLTLQTTIKYVLITLNADNNGEGGIFALYALIRKRKRWVYVLAIIGASALLADGIITPSITVVSAVEGLRMVNTTIPILPIVIVIITFLFLIQQFGTNFLGSSFGPIMFLWFLMLGILGFVNLLEYPTILKAFNPYYAYRFLTHFPQGFVLLGAVFLCTTGAEALYSDLGHCGLNNIRVTWIYVKTALILNYLGQGSYIINHPNLFIGTKLNPFFAIMPPWFLYTGVIVATSAAVIASQALISGSFTIISEAIPLNFWPKVKIMHPTNIKGQMYIPLVNWFLYFSCLFVVLYFRESANMEAAYGLSITITMIMTTMLMAYYLRMMKVSQYIIPIFLLTYLTIEGSFLIANLNKFSHGGWFTIMMAGLLVVVMYVWYQGRNIKKRFTQFVRIKDYAEIISDIRNDVSIPKYSTNLIYLTRADSNTDIESKIIYSIIHKRPKRADTYWFVHVDILDEPRTLEYSIETIIPNVLMRIEFRVGFKIEPRINLFFKQVIEDLVNNNEMNMLSRYPSLQKHKIMGDFRFIIIDRVQNYDFEFSPKDKIVMNLYSFIRRIGIPDIKAFGLDTSSALVEKVPLIVKTTSELNLKRIYAKFS